MVNAAVHLDGPPKGTPITRAFQDFGTLELIAVGLTDLRSVCAEITEEGPRQLMPVAAEVFAPLYPHQQEALAWMIDRENINALPPFWAPLV